MKRTIATITALLLTAPAFAAGDADKGAKTFKKCKSCHMIVSDDGETIAKGGRTGPNLYGVVGRTAGSVDGFKYGKDLMAAGENGLIWTEETLTEFVQDPRAYLRSYLDNSKAKSKMTLKLKKGADDIFAYLVSVGPELPAADDDGATTQTTSD